MTLHSQGTLAISVARLPDPIGSLLMLVGVWQVRSSFVDIRIYNRGLSAAEVKALYDLEKPKGK